MRVSTQTLGRFAEWAVLGLLLFTVLFRGGKSLEATWILAGVAGYITFVSWYVFRSEQRKSIPDHTWIAAMLFILWTLLSFTFSTTKNYGLDEVLRDSSLVLLFFWMMKHATTDAKDIPFIRRFLYAVLIATTLACLVGISVYVLQPVNRFVGTFFDPRFHTDYWPNAWAQYLLLTWPVFLWFLMRAKAHKQYLLRLALLGAVLGCFFLSYSRGASIAFVGQVVFLLVVAWRQLSKDFLKANAKKILFASTLVGVTALCTFLFINSVRQDFYPVQSLTEKVTFTSDEGGSSVSERRQFWGQALSLALRSPLVGWGPYSFRFVQPSYQESVLATSDHPHNIFLKYAAERGIPASIFFILLIIFMLREPVARLLVTRSILQQATSNQQHMPEYLYCVIGIAGVLAHNLIDFNLQFVGIAVPFWLMLGLLPTLESTSRIPEVMKRNTELFLTMLLLLIAVSEGRYLLISSLGRHAEATGNVDRALVWYNRADAEVFSRDMHLSRAQIYLSKKSTAEAQVMINRYMQMNAEDPRAWKLQGDIALAVHDTPLAVQSFEEAYRVNRWNDLWTVTGLLEAQNRADDSQAIGARKKEIDELVQKYAEAIIANTHFIALGSNVEAFLELSHILGIVYPDESAKYDILGARIDRHAKEERAKIQSRAPGYLW